MKSLTNYDRQLIKVCCGSVKQYKQLKKDQRIQELKLIELDNKIKENSLISPRIESIKLERELQELTNKKIEVKNILVKSLPYKEYIIMYDLFNGSYYNFNNDINKGKIIKDNIINVIDKINSIYNIINKKLVIEYMELN